ncbi:hypothetical protein AB0I84_44375 [Streptomyces spectabilis]|uniref:hypothetical protein n=1 Tax=Streptomyces spectabilis TaxID=68270 RepID=UPI0033DECFB2
MTGTLERTWAGAPAWRLLLSAGGLLAVGCGGSLAACVVHLGGLYGLAETSEAWHRVDVVQAGAAAVAGGWLCWRVLRRTGLPYGQLSPRAAGLGAAAVVCAGASVWTAVPSADPTVWEPVPFAVTLTWLAWEVTRSHGLRLQKQIRLADAAERTRWGQVAVLAAIATAVGGVASTLLTRVLPWAADSSVLPVMQDDQLTVLGIDSLSALGAGAVMVVAVEDVVVVAATIALLRAARRPVWQIYALVCVVEVLLHGYMGAAAVGMAPFAAGRIWLYLRFGYLTPLMAGHGAYDVVHTLLMELPPLARVVMMLPVLAALVWVEWHTESQPPAPVKDDRPQAGPESATAAPDGGSATPDPS